MNDDPAAHGLEPALALRSYVAAVKPIAVGRSTSATAAASSPSAKDTDRDAADRLRRRRRPALDQQLRCADRRAAAIRWSGPSAWTTSPSTSVPCRRRVRRPATLIGVDGGERQTAEELASAAADDQLRGSLLDLQARAARLPPRWESGVSEPAADGAACWPRSRSSRRGTGAPGLSAALSATSCSGRRDGRLRLAVDGDARGDRARTRSARRAHVSRCRRHSAPGACARREQAGRST